MAEPTFDRAAFTARLATRRLGRTLIVRAEADSTNDVAWDALATRPEDGVTVVADEQTRGRGRGGRTWHTAPGAGLAMSVVLFRGCEPGAIPLIPLAAGLALADALERTGARVELKWPNDLLLEGRKVAGLLSESRSVVTESATRAVVVGAGVNVGQTLDEFPPELRETATSLALAGIRATRETVAADFLSALEPRWDSLQEAPAEAIVDEWRRRATFWGRSIAVRTPAGMVRGIARDLAAGGRLVVEREDGTRVEVLAGEVESESAGEERVP